MEDWHHMTGNADTWSRKASLIVSMLQLKPQTLQEPVMWYTTIVNSKAHCHQLPHSISPLQQSMQTRAGEQPSMSFHHHCQLLIPSHPWIAALHTFMQPASCVYVTSVSRGICPLQLNWACIHMHGLNSGSFSTARWALACIQWQHVQINVEFVKLSWFVEAKA